jgi:hypothetical protein
MNWNASTRRFALAVLVSLGMIAVGAGFLGAALKRHALAQSEYQHAFDARARVGARLNKAQYDEPAIRRALQRFTEFEKNGLIGEERRLEWADRINRIRADRRIPAIDFELSPQRAIGHAFPGLSINASSMTLRAKLLHEGDLMRILADLKAPGSALVLPRHCLIERNVGDGGENTITISAVCELDWITLNLAALDSP